MSAAGLVTESSKLMLTLPAPRFTCAYSTPCTAESASSALLTRPGPVMPVRANSVFVFAMRKLMIASTASPLHGMVWSGCRKTGIFFSQFALSMRRRKPDFRVSAPCMAATSSRGIPTWAFAITPPPPFAASTCVAAHRSSSRIAHPEINTDSPLRGEGGDPARAAFCEGGYNRNEHPETITRSTMARTREHKLILRPDGQGEF